MTKKSTYGIKYANLKLLEKESKLKDLIPKTFFIDKKYAEEFFLKNEKTSDINLLIESFTNFLICNFPDLVEKVIDKCGGFPLIIRSSGDEDSEDNINAGGYESLPCYSKKEFYEILSKVIFSGYLDKAIKQMNLNNLVIESPKVIPVFIQPLISSEFESPKNLKQVPFLNDHQLKEIIDIIKRLHIKTDLKALDSEWIFDSEYGVISGTALTNYENGQFTGEFSFGFGLFSSQKVSKNLNSTVYLLDDNNLNLWKGMDYLKINDIKKTWILQVRSGQNYKLLNKIEKLSNHSDVLSKNITPILVDDVIVFSDTIKIGEPLKSNSLNEAWNSYISLTIEERSKISFILVEYGTRTEHAGIMFAQENITVFKVKKLDMISHIDYGIPNPINYEFYPLKENFSIDIEIEKSSNISLSKDSIVIFDEKAKNNSKKSINLENIINNCMINEKIIQIKEYKFLSLKQKNKIIEQSLYPNNSTFIQDKDDVFSPALSIRYLELIPKSNLKLDSYKKDISNDNLYNYYQAYLLKVKPNMVSKILNNLYNIDPNLVKSINKNNLKANLLLIELNKSHLNNNVILETLNKYLIFNDMKYLKLLSKVQEDINFLDIYSINEKELILKKYIEILKKTNFKNIDKIVTFIENKIIPIHITFEILIDILNSENKKIEYLIKIYDLLEDIKNTKQNSMLVKCTLNLNDYYKKIIKKSNNIRKFKGYLNNFYSEIIEVYDTASKDILIKFLKNNKLSIYQNYIDMLINWNDFIKIHYGNSKINLEIDKWLKINRNNYKKFKNFYLEDVNWLQTYKEGLSGNKGIVSKNPHQIHNFLHQWSLTLIPEVDHRNLPQNINRIANFANTFAEKNNKIINFQKTFFEIDLAMCTHKASISFYKNSIKVEFNEPPDVNNLEIARLLALKNTLKTFNNWFDTYEFDSYIEKIAGTWTIFIDVRKSHKNSFIFNDYMKVFLIIRFIFDTSYDFSYEENKLLEDVQDKFKEKEWKEIFFNLIEYREKIDDSKQFSDLKAYALSTFLKNLYLEKDIEKLYLNYYKKGYKATKKEILRYDSFLKNTQSFEEWKKLYLKVEALSLLIASNWFLEVIKDLEVLSNYKNIFNILCLNLFKREDFYRYFSSESLNDSFNKSICLKYIPHLFLTMDNAKQMANYILQYNKGYKRCKQYLLFKYPDQLGQKTLEKIINSLEYIPFCETEKNEKIIINIIKSNKKRFNIKNTIFETV